MRQLSSLLIYCALIATEINASSSTSRPIAAFLAAPKKGSSSTGSIKKGQIMGMTKMDINESEEEESIRITNRRSLLNLIVTSTSTSISSAAIIAFASADPAYAFFGIPAKEGPKPAIASDIAGTPIIYKDFISKHKPSERTMVQGLKGDPTYLIVSSDGNRLENYALNAECTHLGCNVPWDPIREKFVCPCHGSQYDATGTVLRGPAPGSLKLAKVGVEEDSGKVLLEPWLEDDFRTGAKPWWI
eukprot:scaffold306_cov223-Chaetoceros_neogracile.AAC.2